jgi:hypothetical protein
MARPADRKGVTVEQRKRWLQRLDEKGESVADIAAIDGYDKRTVSRQVDLARQEREAHEARLLVFRDAVQSHFAQLVEIAEKMQTEVSRGNRVSFLTADRRYVALREHLSRAPLWKLLDSWERTHADIERTREALRMRVEEDLAEDPALKIAFTGGTPDYRNMVRFFTDQAEIWKIGGKGLSIDEHFAASVSDNDMAVMKVGGYSVGMTPEAQVPAVKNALKAYRDCFNSLHEFQRLKDGVRDLNRQQPVIDEELAIIIMKKVVPGRCRYCPA